MAQETEIKLKIDNVGAFWHAIERLGARPIEGNGRVFEQNVIFDTPLSGLSKHGQLLRVRTETLHEEGRKDGTKKRVLLTFKRPLQPGLGNREQLPKEGSYKVREEIELEVSDGGKLKQIFEGLGMRGWFRYEKYRTTLKFPETERWAADLLIELDETPIGTFVELEGPSDAIDRAAHELGYAKADYILKNYLTLYVEECRRKGEEPRNMVFKTEKTPRRRRFVKNHKQKPFFS